MGPSLIGDWILKEILATIAILSLLLSTPEASGGCYRRAGSLVHGDTVVARIAAGDSVYLKDLNIEGHVVLCNTPITAPIDFRSVGCEFLKLSSVECFSTLWFQSCSMGRVIFNSCQFHQRLLFSGVKNDTGTSSFSFKDCMLGGGLDICDSSRIDRIDFSSCVVEEGLALRSSEVSTMEFSDSRWSRFYLENTRLNDASMLSMIRNGCLKGLRYSINPVGLAELRAFAKARHMRQAEREVTCAMQRSAEGRASVNWLLFDLPFEYGANLRRPFIIVGIFIFPLCTLLYFWAFHRPNRKGVIVREYRTSLRGETTVDTRLIRPARTTPGLSGYCMYEPSSGIKRELLLLRSACFFSLLSTFNVGFRDVNLGRWLTLVLPFRAEYEPFGWVRVISGLQSITSVLLIGFGLLMYFGRFFD